MQVRDGNRNSWGQAVREYTHSDSLPSLRGQTVSSEDRVPMRVVRCLHPNPGDGDFSPAETGAEACAPNGFSANQAQESHGSDRIVIDFQG